MCSMVVLILVKHGHMHLVGVRILVKTLNVSSGWNIIRNMECIQWKYVCLGEFFFITHSMFSGSIGFWVKDCRDVEGLIINLCCREPCKARTLVAGLFSRSRGNL